MSEPQDVPGECNARLFISDNYGDNHVTMRCAQEPGHDGPHRERFERESCGEVVITWERGETDE